MDIFKTPHDARARLMRAFNTPFFPDIFVCSDDLKIFLQCRIHYGLRGHRRFGDIIRTTRTKRMNVQVRAAEQRAAGLLQNLIVNCLGHG